MELVLRFGIAILVIAAGAGVYAATTRLRLWALRRGQRAHAESGLEDFRLGVPAILYFTTPNCAPCHTLQGPAIQKLRDQLGGRLQVFQVDASARPDLANHWGVLSVPTTFILDAQGQPRHVNNGIVSAAKLRRQLGDFAGLAEPHQV